MFNDFGYKRKVEDRAVTGQLVFVQGGYLEKGDMVDCLRKGQVDDIRDCGMRTDEHSFRSQVGIGSELDCLLGRLERISEIFDSVAGLKVEKYGDVAGGGGK